MLQSIIPSIAVAQCDLQEKKVAAICKFSSSAFFSVADMEDETMLEDISFI